MKKRVPMFMLYVIITTVLIYFSKRTADVFSYAGFLFDDVPQLKYGMLSVIIFVYYFLIIRRYPLGSNFGLRTLLVHILFSFMIIPMVVYSIFSSFTPQIVIGYNVAILALDVAMCTGPVLVPKSRVRPAKFVRFLYLVFFLISIYFTFVVGIRSGVLLYIIRSGFKYDIYRVRSMFFASLSSIEGYVIGNYLIFFGPFVSILLYNTTKQTRALGVVSYVINVILSGNKAPILYLVLALFVANVNFDRVITRRNILYLTYFCCGVIVFISGLSYMYDVPFEIYFVSMLGRRTFFTPVRIAEAYFLEFPKESPFLGFAGLFRQDAVLAGAGAGVQGALRYYISQKYFGTSGAANTNFIAEAYANFGYIAIFLYSFTLGKMIRLMDFASFKMPNSIRRVFLATSILPLLQLVNVSFTTTLMSFGLMLAFMFSIFLVDIPDNI